MVNGNGRAVREGLGFVLRAGVGEVVSNARGVEVRVPGYPCARWTGAEWALGALRFPTLNAAAAVIAPAA